MAQRRNLLQKAIGNPGPLNGKTLSNGVKGPAAGGMNFGKVLNEKPKSYGAPSAPSAPKPDPTGNPKVTMPTGPKAITAENFTAQGEAGVAGLTSYNPASGQPDPRNSEYWKNFYLLRQQAQTGYGAALNEQTQADVAYNRSVNDLTDNRSKSRKSMARSLIGTGLLRSGYHNEQQTEGDSNYLTDLSRMATDKAGQDSARANERQGILGDFAAQEYGLYGDAATNYADQQAKSNAESDPTYGGKRSLKSFNKQLDHLKERYKNADSDKQRKVILGKIKDTRAAKNKSYGKK